MRTTQALLLAPLLLAGIIAANALQMLSLLLLPFSGGAFRAANRRISGAWFGALLWALKGPLGVKIQVTGDPLPVRENVILIANHQAMADIPVLLQLARNCDRLGDLKWFVKDPLKWVPGVGWGMLFLDCLFVKRNWTADKEKVLATFARLRAHQSPFWVISFLEGTRATAAKLERSRAFARKAGLPLLERVMLPRSKGFLATVEALGPSLDAVYDATLRYEGRPPSLPELFLKVKSVELHVRRFPLAILPQGREALESWVVQRYQEKDQWLGAQAPTTP